MNIYLTIIATVVLLFSVIFFKDKPDIDHPEENQGAGQVEVNLPVIKAMIILVKDRSFIYSVLSHSFAISFFFSFTTVLE